MADGDKFLYTGALLYCDKGSLIMPFVAMPKKHRLYGPFIGTTLDIVPQLNIPSLGICTVTRMPCVPVLPQWEKYHDGALWIEKFRPLLVTSVCRCKCGGTIRIFDTRKSALAAASAPGASEILAIAVDGLKKRIDREIGSSLMAPPFGSILKELPYAGEVVEALGRGMRKGAADTLTGLYEMITDPLGTLGGIATLAGIATVGYGQYTSLPMPEGYKTPEERLAKFDETFGTNLTDAHEGIKSAVDEKITEFDQADGLGKAEMTAEATGYVMVMIVDAVYGSKCTSKLSKAAKMSKLGRAARASKVGQSIAKLTNKAETLAELLKTAAKNKAKTLWNKLPKTRKGIFWVKSIVVLKKLRKILYADALELAELDKTLRGPVVARAYDKKTGRISGRFINTKKVPDNLDPLLRERIEKLNKMGRKHFSEPGTHAEVLAVDELIKARRANGEIVTESVFEDIVTDQYWLDKRMGQPNEGINPAPTCENCSDILKGTTSQAGSK